MKAVFLFTNGKNVLDAHRSCLLGGGSFGHPVQLLKRMDLRVSPIIYTLFEQCDILNLSNCTEIDEWDSFVQFAKLKAVFLFRNGKMSWILTGAVSLETVLLGTQDNC